MKNMSRSTKYNSESVPMEMQHWVIWNYSQTTRCLKQ